MAQQMSTLAEPEPTRSPTDAHACVEWASALYLEVAVRCLTSRLSLLAIAVLLVNDHLLKARYPSWLTGKLSDFAGLYFAPFLFIVALPLPGSPVTHVTALASASSQPGRLFAAEDQQLLRSEDYGDTWTTLALLSEMIVLARLLNPRPFRRFLGVHTWDLALASWALVPALVLARALWSRLAGDELTDTLMVAAVAAPGLVYVLTRVRLNWVTLGLATAPALLILAATVVLDESWLPFGVGLVPLALAAAVLLLRASRPRLARIALVLVTIAGNGVFLAFLALDFMFRNAFPACVG